MTSTTTRMTHVISDCCAILAKIFREGRGYEAIQTATMVQRLTFRRRLSYNTKSNRRTVVKTPGGRLVYHYLKKAGKVPRCGHCKIKLPGIEKARSIERSRMSRRRKMVKRSYGGVLCHKCVKEKIVRAFLIEEQKIVQKVIRAQAAAAKGKKNKK
ncbi:hypothetical protein WDU94_003789 [Cyamophila willieti]